MADYEYDEAPDASDDFLASTEAPEPFDPDADGVCEVCQ
jgi:hypothetical protein